MTTWSKHDPEFWFPFRSDGYGNLSYIEDYIPGFPEELFFWDFDPEHKEMREEVASMGWHLLEDGGAVHPTSETLRGEAWGHVASVPGVYVLLPVDDGTSVGCDHEATQVGWALLELNDDELIKFYAAEGRPYEAEARDLYERQGRLSHEWEPWKEQPEFVRQSWREYMRRMIEDEWRAGI